MHGMNIKAVYT